MTQIDLREPAVAATTLPGKGEFLAMGVCAILLRLVLLAATMITFHRSFASLAEIADGHSYIAYARAMLGEKGVLTDFDRRVFPGYPLAIAGVRLLGFSFPLAAMGVSWVSTALASVFAALLTGSRRVGWGMVCLTPHYLLYSSIAANEPILLLCCTGGLVLAMRGIDGDQPVGRGLIWLICGGLVLGFGGVVRPFACFAVAGFLVHAARQRKWLAAVVVSVASMMVVGAGMVGLWLFTGDALQGAKTYRDNPRAYGGELYSYPFKSLIHHSLHGHVPVAKLLYVWVYVVVNLGAIVMITHRLVAQRRHPPDRTDLFWTWLVFNTLAILCVGSVWGFEAFHRFNSWALPAELLALLPFLPRRTWTWMAVATGSFAIALYSINRN